MKEKRKKGRVSQAVTKDLSSSSKFSGSCVLTLQTLPKRKEKMKRLLTPRSENVQHWDLTSSPVFFQRKGDEILSVLVHQVAFILQSGRIPKPLNPESGPKDKESLS